MEGPGQSSWLTRTLHLQGGHDVGGDGAIFHGHGLFARKAESGRVRQLTADVRRARDGKAAAAAAARLAKAARLPKENLFPHILRAVESKATLGEIFATLRDAFGEHHAR